MNLRTIASRAVVGGTATVLAAGALVGATSTASNAEDWTASNIYTCDFGGLVTGDINATVTISLPVSQYTAATPVPAGIVPISISAPLPADVVTKLGTAGITTGSSDDFAISLGTGNVPAPQSGDFTDGTWQSGGGNLAFTTGDPGEVNGYLPTGFTLALSKADGSPAGSGACTLKDAEPALIVSGFQLGPQFSSTTVPASVKAKKGKKVLLPVSVRSTTISAPVSAGSVVAKEGSKTLGTADLVNGAAKIDLGKLKVGKHKITVTYLGIPSVQTSSARTTVTVK